MFRYNMTRRCKMKTNNIIRIKKHQFIISFYVLLGNPVEYFRIRQLCTSSSSKARQTSHVLPNAKKKAALYLTRKTEWKTKINQTVAKQKRVTWQLLISTTFDFWDSSSARYMIIFSIMHYFASFWVLQRFDVISVRWNHHVPHLPPGALRLFGLNQVHQPPDDVAEIISVARGSLFCG